MRSNALSAYKCIQMRTDCIQMHSSALSAYKYAQMRTECMQPRPNALQVDSNPRWLCVMPTRAFECLEAVKRFSHSVLATNGLFKHRPECSDTSGTFFEWSARKLELLKVPDAQTKGKVA